MKIERTGAGGAGTAARRADRLRRTGDGQFARTLDRVFGQADATPAVAGTGAATSVDSLLAAQATADESPQGRRRQAYARAGQQLSALTELQRRLLAGMPSADDLQALARAAAEPRPGIDDPRLRQVLDEIDLRVQVELAKRHLHG